MAIAVRNIATATAGNAGNPGTITISKPTGTVDGDLMYAFFQSSTTDSGTISTLSGWTLVDSDTTAGAASYLFRKTASSEGSSYGWSYGALGGFSLRGTIISVYDSDGNNPTQDVYTKTADASADTTADNTGVTPTFSPGSLLIAFIGIGQTATSLSGYAVADNDPTWTEAEDEQTSFGGAVTTMAIAHATRNLITATGAFSATIADAATTAVYLVSVQPSGVSATAGFAIAEAIPTPTESSAQTASAGFSGAVAMLDSTVTEADSEWQNTTKSSSSWTNTSKS